ncbi:MAG: carboxylesterase family protein [Oscillospiraceae bacterium]|nr:carboxylesterase family protein [Oscillospiraceae bacterium]
MMEYLVNTPCGPVQGTAGRVPGTADYKGIRYATAGRWEYPVQVTGWEGTYDATAYGACSYQPRSFYNEEENLKKIFYYREFRKGETYDYSEDCLFLNVFTPDTAKEGDKLPVLIYIHGGGFTGGCGHEKHFDGPVWPAKGIIGVTLNYRLGPMGFVCLPELKEEAGFTGNNGLYDQMIAIKWVKDNIASFGGDPGNITIMGQSAGGMSVQQHCLSPLTDGLFQKAVMSSGGGVSRMLSAGAPEKRYEFWKAAMKKAGCETLEEFRAISPEKLFAVWNETRKEVKGGGCFPCLDGRFVVGTGTDLLAAGKQKQIHYMAGTTSEDMMPPIMQKMSRDWCAAQKVSSYTWFFDRQLPGDDNGAWHSSDLWYWFGTLENCWRPMTDKDRALSDLMTDYLCNFVKTGDPNGEGLPQWLPSGSDQKKVMCMGEKDAAMDKPNLFKLIKTMLTNKAVGE